MSLTPPNKVLIFLNSMVSLHGDSAGGQPAQPLEVSLKLLQATVLLAECSVTAWHGSVCSTAEASGTLSAICGRRCKTDAFL